jgi:hypothetical protein
MSAVVAKLATRASFVLALCAVAGCSGDSFDLSDYDGRYTGPASLTVRQEGEGGQTVYGEGRATVEPVAGAQVASGRLDVGFDDRRLFLFEGPYDSDGWSLAGVGERAFQLHVDTDGRITGTLDRPELRIDMDGLFVANGIALTIEMDYVAEVGGIPAGTRISIALSLGRS